MDFVSDVPGPVSLNSDSKFSAPSVEALPPQARADVLKKLQGMSPEERAQKEPELVFEAVRGSVAQTRALTGVGSNALPYHKEAAEIAGQVYQLNREYDQLTTQLDRMTFETRFNEETGKNEPVEVPVLSGIRRKGYADRLNDIARQRRLLVNEDGSDGIEAAKRLQKAAIESARILKQRDDEAAEHAAAVKMAEDMARTSRIEAKAKSIVALKGHGGH